MSVERTADAMSDVAFAAASAVAVSAEVLARAIAASA